VREHRDEHGNVSYVQEARLHLNRSTEMVTTDMHAHEIPSMSPARVRTTSLGPAGPVGPCGPGRP
jgi:hypothetical protein